MREEVAEFGHAKEIAKGAFWTLGGNATFYLISFVYTIVVARVVSQDDLGLFFLTLGIASILSLFDGLGLSNSLVRYVPYLEAKREPGKAEALLGMSRVLVLSSSIAVAALLWLFSGHLGGIYQNGALPEMIRLFSGYIVLKNLFELHQGYLRGKRRIKLVQLCSNLQNISKLAFTLLLIHFIGPGAIALGAGLLLSFAFPTILSLVLIASEGRGAPHGQAEDAGGPGGMLSEILPYGIMMGFNASLAGVVVSSSALILGLLIPPDLSARTVAIYSVAANLAWMLFVLPTSIGSIFLPLMSNLHGKGEMGRIRRLTQTAQRWCVLLTMPIALVMILHSDGMLALLYGQEYAAGGTVMAILAAGIMLKATSFAPAQTLSAMRQVMAQIAILSASGIVTIILNFLLIPSLGMEGSAVACVAGFFVSAYLLTRRSGQVYGFRMPGGVVRLWLAGGMSFLIIILLDTVVGRPAMAGIGIDMAGAGFGALGLAYIALLTGASIGIFFVTGMKLRCFRAQDLRLMAGALGRAGIPDRLIQKLASFFGRWTDTTID